MDYYDEVAYSPSRHVAETTLWYVSWQSSGSKILMTEGSDDMKWSTMMGLPVSRCVA